jgi:uncharacterized protein with GYD domain
LPRFARKDTLPRRLRAVFVAEDATALIAPGWEQQRENPMPMFICSLSWTDQGIRTIKDVPKRVAASRELAKKMGVEVKQVYLTSGNDDIVVIVDTPNGDNVAKWALALGSQGNVRTRTARAWPESEFLKMISELP